MERGDRRKAKKEVDIKEKGIGNKKLCYLSIFCIIDSIYLSTYKLVYLSSIYLSLYLSIYLSVCFTSYQSFLYLSAHLYKSICLFISLYLSIYITIYPFFSIFVFILVYIWQYCGSLTLPTLFNLIIVSFFINRTIKFLKNYNLVDGFMNRKKDRDSIFY